jgi:phage-related protein
MSDLALNPDYVYDEEIQYKTLISQFENGYEQRRGKWANPLRKFTLVYNNRTTTEIGTLKTLFTTKLGALTSFTWTNPNDSVEYTVRFDADSFKFSNKAYGVYDLQFSLTQVK